MIPGFLRSLSIAALALTLANGLSAGLAPETGLYSFQVYTPDQYGAASPQNWAVAQDRRGVMYFGNTDGVLEFDGRNWRLIQAKGGVRSLAAAPDGTVYVGASGDFGYLQPDAHGVQRFVSLAGGLAPKDSQFKGVWRVFLRPDGVYFGSYSWLIRRDSNGKLKVWRPASTFGKAFEANGVIYVRSPEEGLLALVDEKLVPVPGGDVLAKTDPRFDPVGAVESNGEAIVATQERLYRLSTSGLRPFEANAAAYLATNLMYSLARLPGGPIAIGTRRGGMVLMDDSGSTERIVREDDGLPGAYVTSVASDREGAVWLTTVNGIARFNPGLSTFAKSQGLMGNVLCVTRAAGDLYAGTMAGLYRLVRNPGSLPRFERVSGIEQSVFVLWASGGELLAGASSGVFSVHGNVATHVDGVTGTIFDINPSLTHPGSVYAAGGEGVFILARSSSGGWVKEAIASEAGQEFRTVAEDADGRVWATTRNRIWRLDFSKQPVAAENFSPPSASTEGWQNAYRFRGHVVFGTEAGLMRFSEKFRRLVPDSSLGSVFADGSRDVYNVTEDRSGSVWITGRNYHGILRHTKAGDQWYGAPFLEAKIQQIYNMFADMDGTIWAFGKDYKLFRWSPSLAGDPSRDFRILNRGIAVLDSPEPLYGGTGPVPEISVKYRDNALTFQFAAPFFEDSSSVEYQFQLEGGDRGWSPWTHEAKTAFSHLPEGNYKFRVRARNPHGSVTEESLSAVAIAPPWYRTWWAFGLYAVAAVIFVWGVVKLRVQQLQEDKRRLENTVAERTVEIRKQRDEIHVQERKSHSLLLNILPAQVADELKHTGAVQPVGFDDVTVCFTDFVGFTLSSEKMPPADLVDALNEYFTAFDEIIARYGLEKLKTIGDSYMFVSGLPERRASHAVDAVLAAMEMVQVVKNLAAKTDSTGWNIRVGLHSGPVVAGVVGIRKFAFDIWGNTVNFAARMESSGVPGSVNMSERTCRLTRGLIECEGRGNVRIKEGRELLMFLARGVAPDFAARYEEEFGLAPRTLPVLEKHSDEKVFHGAAS